MISPRINGDVFSSVMSKLADRGCIFGLLFARMMLCYDKVVIIFNGSCTSKIDQMRQKKWSGSQ